MQVRFLQRAPFCYNDEMKSKSKFNFTNVLWYLVFGLGYLILYLDYFSPTEWGKKRNVAVTSRKLRYKHIWGPITAITVYFIIAMFILSGT